MSKIAEQTLGLDIINRGKQMNCDIADQQTELVRKFKTANYFSVAVANAFTWTGHAVSNSDFFKVAIDYISSGNLNSLDETANFSGRFGDEKLANGLRSWRTIISHIQVANIQKATAQNLVKLQSNAREVADRLQKQHLISGIGLWLLYAPFKIVAVHLKNLWNDERLNEVRMPLGLEVIRGVKKLIRRKSVWSNGYDENMMTEEEGGLKEGMGTAEMVHDISAKIAYDKNIACNFDLRRIIHVNSGIFLLGKGDL
jgi:hypothetical protein